MRNSSLVALLLGVFATFCQAAPIMPNPSFETGDLTGWSEPDHMTVASGPASDGSRFLTADVEWIFSRGDVEGIPLLLALAGPLLE